MPQQPTFACQFLSWVRVSYLRGKSSRIRSFVRRVPSPCFYFFPLSGVNAVKNTFTLFFFFMQNSNSVAILEKRAAWCQHGVVPVHTPRCGNARKTCSDSHPDIKTLHQPLQRDLVHGNVQGSPLSHCVKRSSSHSLRKGCGRRYSHGVMVQLLKGAITCNIS